MEVRELRLQTGLSQSKFAKMFDIPVSALKDWEQERRNPPAYVINMMRKILQYKGFSCFGPIFGSWQVGRICLVQAQFHQSVKESHRITIFKNM